MISAPLRETFARLGVEVRRGQRNGGNSGKFTVKSHAAARMKQLIPTPTGGATLARQSLHYNMVIEGSVPIVRLIIIKRTVIVVPNVRATGRSCHHDCRAILDENCIHSFYHGWAYCFDFISRHKGSKVGGCISRKHNFHVTSGF